MFYQKPNGIKIYAAVKMTGRYCDELVEESTRLKDALEYAGFTVLSPVIEEKVPNEHVVLMNQVDKLREYWKRDKEMLQEAHLMLDFNSQGTSDGVNVEMGYCRFFMFKPLIRVHPSLGCVISKLEYDCVVKDLESAIIVMQEQWGTKHKLLVWRLNMLIRSIPKLLWLHAKFLLEVL